MTAPLLINHPKRRYLIYMTNRIYGGRPPMNFAIVLDISGIFWPLYWQIIFSIALLYYYYSFWGAYYYVQVPWAQASVAEEQAR